ncbi:MAG: GAF domain-containing protein [Candidatus Brocadia sp.]|nr:GAF domain-containing protein [Candidatus Brocadia sp.]
MKVLLIGAGKGGSSLLPILQEDKEIEIVGVVDKNQDAEGLEIARQYNIPTYTCYENLIKRAPLDVIIDVTKNPQVLVDIEKNKSANTEILGGISAKLLWNLVEERKKKEEEIQKSLSEQKALYRIGIMISSAIAMNDVFQTIVKSGLEVTNTPAGSLALYDEEKHEMELTAVHGFSPEFSLKATRWKVRPGGLTSKILSQKQPVVVSDICQESSMDTRVILAEGIRSLVATPLSTEDKIVGILYVDDYKPRSFTQRDISILELLATQASIAIKKAKTREQLELKNNELRRTTDYLHNILDNSADVIITTDTENNVVEFNRGAEEILGYAQNETVGKPLSQYFTNPGHCAFLLEKVKQEGKISNHETQFVTKQQKTIDISLTLSQLKDSSGNMIGTVGISKDITEFKRTQAQLVQAGKLAGIGQLAAGIAHEINNPLSGVLGYAKRLMNKAGDEELKKIPAFESFPREIKLIVDSALRCKKIIDGLLKFSRTSETMSMDVNVNEVIKESLILFGNQLSSQNIELNKVLDPRIPTIRANHTQIQQVFTDIIINAIQAMQQGGRLTIITRNINSSAVEIEFTDTGEGITKENLSKIFEPFFTTREPGKGTGLGLYMIYRILQDHHGRIDVKSEAGKGATFTITLPCKQSAVNSGQ